YQFLIEYHSFSGKIFFSCSPKISHPNPLIRIFSESNWIVSLTKAIRWSNYRLEWTGKASKNILVPALAKKVAPPSTLASWSAFITSNTPITLATKNPHWRKRSRSTPQANHRQRIKDQTRQARATQPN
ncbi:MAG: hypothetical protein RSB48_07765, partial [Akkermansia sp.]